MLTSILPNRGGDRRPGTAGAPKFEQAASGPYAAKDRILLGFVLVAVVIFVLQRVFAVFRAPLWLDEVFTGFIAIQPKFSGLVHDTLNELGGPLFYWIVWFWEKVAGSSNGALRLPTFIFAVATPLIILFWGHPDRQTRLLWTAIVALWLNGVWFGSEARAYSLLFLLGTIQAIFFQRLLREPTLKRTWAWTAVVALMALTHYHTLVISGLQGLVYLWFHKGRALRNWIAAAAFIPVIVWMVLQYPYLTEFAKTNVTWHRTLTLHDARILPNMLFGGDNWVIGTMMIAVAAGLAWDLLSWLRGRKQWPYDWVDVATAATGLAAIAFVFGLGFLRPSFVSRYLVPYMPAVLLGLAVWARRWGKRSPLVPAAILIVLLWYALGDLKRSLSNPRDNFRFNYTYELASADLAKQKVKSVTYFLDNPVIATSNEPWLARAGSFFFDRAGYDVDVKALLIASARNPADPNLVFLRSGSEAWRPETDAFIWIHDVLVSGTLAIRYPPRFAELLKVYRCHDYSKSEDINVLVCIRRTVPTVPGTPR